MIIRWLIGFITAWAILVVVSNIIEYYDPLTGENVTLLELMLGYQTVSSADPTGGTFSGLATPVVVIKAIANAFLFRYPFFNYNLITQLVWLIVFFGCTVGMFVTLALTLRQVISGT